MAVTNYTDFVLDNTYMHTGVFEAVTQKLDLFNEVSGGAIRLVNEQIVGHFNDDLFYQTMEDAWKRRDITASTAISSADTTKVVELDQRGVKFNAKMFVPWTRHAFQKNFDPAMKGDYQEVSRRIGQGVGVSRLKQQVNHALLALTAALKARLGGDSGTDYGCSVRTNRVSTANYNGKCNSNDFNETRALMGDMAGRLACVVMHSTPYFNLIGQQTNDKIMGVSDFNLFKGQPATYGLPTLVTDSPSLKKTTTGSTGYTEYYSLFLVPEAATITNSEPETVIVQPKLGNENITIDMHGEGAHNIQLKGFQWDQTNGGINPTEAALGTGTNWDPVSVSVKNRAGAVMVSR